MTALVFQSIIILLPGFIWMKLEEASTRTNSWHNYERLVRSIFYGLFTYITLYLVYWIFNQDFSLVDIPTDDKKTFLSADQFDEIVLSVPLSFALATAWCAAKNKKLIINFLRKIDITKTFGDEDVWQYIFNSPSATTEYVHLRDFDRNWVYCGWLVCFSDERDIRELYLRDVIVYDFEGNEQMTSPSIYIAREAKNLTIEFPHRAEKLI